MISVIFAAIIFFAGFLLGPLWGDFWETQEHAPQKTVLDRNKFDYEVDAAEWVVEGDAFPTCAAGDYRIWADLAKSVLMTCNNGTVAALGPASGLYIAPDGNTIYMYTQDGDKVEYELSPEWKLPVVAQ